MDHILNADTATVINVVNETDKEMIINRNERVGHIKDYEEDGYILSTKLGVFWVGLS